MLFKLMDIETLKGIRKKTLSQLYSKRDVIDKKTYKALVKDFQRIPEFKLKGNMNIDNVKNQRKLNSDFKSYTKISEKLTQLTGKVNTIKKVNEIVKANKNDMNDILNSSNAFLDYKTNDKFKINIIDKNRARKKLKKIF